MDLENQVLDLPENQRPLNYKQWALYGFIAGLPLIGIIILLFWAFSDGGNIHRKEWAKGMLLIMVIFAVLSGLMIIFFGGLAAMLGDFG